MVIFDTCVLTLFIDPSSNAPIDPNTGTTVTDASQRVELLFQTLEANREQALLPAPVLAELCICFGSDFVTNRLAQYSCFHLGEFGLRAAVEAGISLHVDRNTGAYKALAQEMGRHRLKFDRQIISIGKVHKASTIYSDDEKLKKHAIMQGLNVVSTYELPLPAQASFNLTQPSPATP